MDSKKQLAKLLKEQQEQEFKAKKNETQNERLKHLLKYTEVFAHFILSSKKSKGG